MTNQATPPLDLAVIEARANAVKIDNWKLLPRETGDKELVIQRGADGDVTIDYDDVDHDQAWATAVFVEAAPVDVPALIARVRDLEADNARLAAIMGKLPRTADGAPVVPDMTLYHQCGADLGVAQMHKPACHVGRAARTPGCFGQNANGTWAVVVEWDQVYSTRAAAEAARAGGGSK